MKKIFALIASALMLAKPRKEDMIKYID